MACRGGRRAALRDEPDIAYALLFGSGGRGALRPGSDADVSIELRPGAARDAAALGRLAARLDTAADRQVDLVLLDEAPAPLACCIFRDGQIILERDHAALVGRKVRAILDYLDFKPLEDRCAERGLPRLPRHRGRSPVPGRGPPLSRIDMGGRAIVSSPARQGARASRPACFAILPLRGDERDGASRRCWRFAVTPSEPDDRNAMRRVIGKLKEELLAVLPPTSFFFVALHVIAIIRALMVRGSNFRPLSTISITVAALILGKAVLIADMLPVINRYPDKPLAYNVAWKSTIYLLVAAIIHYLERLVDFSRQAGGLAAGNAKLLAEMVWAHFWAVQLVLFMLIVMYCTARELVRVIGRDKVVRLFFGPPPLPDL